MTREFIICVMNDVETINYRTVGSHNNYSKTTNYLGYYFYYN